MLALLQACASQASLEKKIFAACMRPAATSPKLDHVVQMHEDGEFLFMHFSFASDNGAELSKQELELLEPDTLLGMRICAKYLLDMDVTVLHS